MITTHFELQCGCKGTVSPNKLTDPCAKHESRRNISWTGNQVPLTMDGPAPRPVKEGSGQHESYFISAEEDRKGFVRPVRNTYVHSRCGVVTTMGRALAETYAANPQAYGATFCAHCGKHFPVGEDGEFVWEGTDIKVGT